jgi:hypothetical protein
VIECRHKQVKQVTGVTVFCFGIAVISVLVLTHLIREWDSRAYIEQARQIEHNKETS